ncbi:MAG: hypothetical protein R3350_05420 [Saprospiraceae bacterium]|nr:hypothetical protein [Saprospiraceae bacterium]
MKSSHENLEKIKKYVRGELSGEEHTAFEAQLAEDPQLREEVEWTRRIIQGTESFERKRLLSLIEEVDGKPVKRGRLRWLARSYRRAATVAAAAIILLLIGFFSLQWFGEQSDPLLEFQQMAYVEPNFYGSSTRGSSANLLNEALQAYRSDNYTQALSLLDRYDPQDSMYLLAQFYRGHIHYQLEQYEAAIRSFEVIGSTRGDVYLMPSLENAQWTQLLSQYQRYRQSKSEADKTALLNALDTFRQSADPTDIYHQKATRLQELLKEEN